MGEIRPLVMLKTNRESYGYVGEKIVDFTSKTLLNDVDIILTQGHLKLDGIYCEWSKHMLDHGWTNLMNLCSHVAVGVWLSAGDPDNFASARALAKLGVRFVNS